MIKNATQKPRRYYGIHMAPGVAEYQKKEGPEVIFLNENVIKKMDASFEGCPVYVNHVDDVNFKEFKEEDADGYVVNSFYNKADGKHWVEFMVVSDAGHEAVSKGFRLSNAYHPKQYGTSGLWHGVEYQKEVLEGEYEHLALVKNPRYDESVILTPEQFKQYNASKEIELSRIANSKDKPKGAQSMNFGFFKKEKVENSAELENTMVTLPLSKIDMPLSQVINELDAIKNMHGYASPDHMVKVGNEEMSVAEMSEQYNAMRVAKKNEEDMKKKAEEEAKAKNEADKGKEDHFAKLQNAHLNANFTETHPIVDGISLGKSRYGATK